MRFFVLPIIIVFLGCGQAKSSADQNSKVSTYEDTSNSIEADVNSKEALKVDSLSLLLDDLKEFTQDDDKWKVVGGLKTAELRYKDVYFGDLYHLIFIGDDKKEYDFNGNRTKIELDKNATTEDDEDGIEPNKKYLNKKFRVVWRHLKLKGKPKDEMEMYYEEHDEIVYLKQLK
jgi:hypothetical protein